MTGRQQGPSDQEVVFADEDGDFPLTGGGFGNPGCDRCGMGDAAVRIGATYACSTCSDVVPRQLVITFPMHGNSPHVEDDLVALARLVTALLAGDDRLAGQATVTPGSGPTDERR